MCEEAVLLPPTLATQTIAPEIYYSQPRALSLAHDQHDGTDTKLWQQQVVHQQSPQSHLITDDIVLLSTVRDTGKTW